MGTILKSLVDGSAFRFLMTIPTVGHGVAYLLEHLDTGLVRFERDLSQYVKHEDQTLAGKFDPQEETGSDSSGSATPAPAPSGPPVPSGGPELPPSVSGPQSAPGGAPEGEPPASDLPPLGG